MAYSEHFEDSINSARSEDNFNIPQPKAEKININEQKEIDDFFNYFDKILKSEEIKGERFYSINKSNEIKSALYSIDLDKILNEYLKSPIIFKTSKGTIVHVSGSKSSNCPNLSNNCKDKEKFFMVLTTSRNESFFIRAMKIINWSIFMSGSKTVVIDGEEYTVKVYANISEPEKSRLEIKGPSGIVINSTLDKLGEALSTKGIDLRLGKNYKLAYGNEIVQTGNGNAKFTENKLLLFFPFPVKDASNYYIIKANDIKSEGTSFPSMEPDYIFKIGNNILEIYKK